MPKKRTMIYSNVKQNKKKSEEISRIKDEQINLDDEFFIGLSEDITDRAAKDMKEKNKSKKKFKNKKKNKAAKKNKALEQKVAFKNSRIKKVKNTKNEEFLFDKDNYTDKNNIPKRKISKIKVSILFVIIIAGLVIFLSSSIFNVKNIDISINNQQVLTVEDIKVLTDTNIGDNIFEISKKNISNEIQKNPYVQSVKVSKQLPNKLKLDITERTVKFQLSKGGVYINIDSSGYIMSESEERKDVLLIAGLNSSEIICGNRMGEDDLNKLSDVIQIAQEAKNKEIEDKITQIDITDKNNYKLYFDSEGKVAYIGNANLINDKMAYIKKILEMESDYEGEIFVNVDLSGGEYPYFREKV